MPRRAAAGGWVWLATHAREGVFVRVVYLHGGAE
jgi:hypothetical protein